MLDPTSTANISMQISDDADLSLGLILKSSKKPSNVSLLKDYIGMLSSADSPTPAGRAASFLSLVGTKVQVEFEIVCRRLRRRVLEAVTRERHGDDGVRLLRLLLDTGKMDEKQVNFAPLLSRYAPHLFMLDLEGCHDGCEGRTATAVGYVFRVAGQHPGGT